MPCSMWDLPGPGIEPMSPALAGGFFTTEPPGKSWGCLLFALTTACNDLFLCGIICLPSLPPLCRRSHGERARAVLTHRVTNHPDLPLSHGFPGSWSASARIRKILSKLRQWSPHHGRHTGSFQSPFVPDTQELHVERDCRGIPA